MWTVRAFVRVHAGRPFPRLRILLKASSAVSSASGRACRYLCVVEMSECPSRSLTTARSAPPAKPGEAGVPQVMPHQVLVAELGDDFIPVGRVPQHRC